jgi:CDP-diacylglycerol--glycerol-3-phosphate 3-phosphatidyltransferase
MKKYIPNSLTLFRIALVPVFIWFLFFSQDNHSILWTMIIFTFASITDFLDGLLARKLKVVSEFGKYMDPLADKILVITALLALYIKLNYISLTLVIIILTREIIISILREYYAAKKIFIPVNFWGKVKTFMQMTGIILALLYYYIDSITEGIFSWHDSFIIACNIFFWIVAFLTWYSGINYFRTEVRKKQ